MIDAYHLRAYLLADSYHLVLGTQCDIRQTRHRRDLADAAGYFPLAGCGYITDDYSPANT